MQPMKFFKDKFYIELVLASILFLIALSLDMLMDFIIYMLYFIIFLEIVRAVVNFIREQRVVLAIIVDAFIILTLRELIVNVVKINAENIDTLDSLMHSSLNFNILVLSGVIIFLLVVRYLAVKTSQRYMFSKKEENENLKDD
jgi:uncharacterized membrane protein (DUF373 family)